MNNTMTVTIAPGDDRRKPMIRISNRHLLKSGFVVGSKYAVIYGIGVITLRKINNI
jgi:hypothetical protein